VSLQDPICQFLAVATGGFHDDRRALEFVGLESGKPGLNASGRSGIGVDGHALEGLVAPPGHIESGLGNVDPLKAEGAGLGLRKVCHRASRGTELGLHFPLRTEAPIAFGQVPMWCPAIWCCTRRGGPYITDGHLAHERNNTAPPFSNSRQPCGPQTHSTAKAGC
jgi:hypothetical protein